MAGTDFSPTAVGERDFGVQKGRGLFYPGVRKRKGTKKSLRGVGL